jgi:hypothetical protein
MSKQITIILAGILLFGCAPEKYRKADFSFYGGAKGYYDKELKPGVHQLEYAQIGGYNFNLELNKKYWLRRASELCPSGFDGGYKVIHPAYAKTKFFVCPQRYCTKYPIVSGVITCKKT